MHARSMGQALPQLPQLSWSVPMSTQEEPQAMRPPLQTWVQLPLSQ